MVCSVLVVVTVKREQVTQSCTASSVLYSSLDIFMVAMLRKVLDTGAWLMLSAEDSHRNKSKRSSWWESEWQIHGG